MGECALSLNLVEELTICLYVHGVAWGSANVLLFTHTRSSFSRSGSTRQETCQRTSQFNRQTTAVGRDKPFIHLLVVEQFSLRLRNPAQIAVAFRDIEEQFIPRLGDAVARIRRHNSADFQRLSFSV